jgi:hypothetical protein
MHTNEIAIVILSCDRFKITWQPCIDHFFNAWPTCPYPVYLLNNLVSADDNRIINLMVGQDDSWSESLIKGLFKITQKRVFFIFDDSFITSIDINKIKIIFEASIINDLNSVALLKKRFDRGENFNNDIFKLNPKTKYRNSLFLNLFKRDLLLDILKPNENAWQFEKIGSKRTEEFDFYSVKSADLVQYYHGIIKGKWLPETYMYLQNQGYILDDTTFDIYTRMQVARLKIYEKTFNIYQKLYHLFIWILKNKNR